MAPADPDGTAVDDDHSLAGRDRAGTEGGPREGTVPHFPFSRVLVVRFGRIGDMLVVTPAVRALRRATPDAKIDLLTSGEGRLVFSANANIDSVHVLNWRRVPRAVNPERARLVRTLRQVSYDAVFLFEGGERFHAIVRDIGADPVYTFARAGDAVDAFHAARGRHHELQNFFAVLDLAHVTPAGVHYDFPIAPEPRARAARLLNEYGVPPDAPVFGVHAGHFQRTRVGRGPHPKAWPLERWVRLIDDIAARDTDIRVVLTGGSSERALNRAIAKAAQTRNVVDLAGRTDLPTLAAIIERCTALVSPDTGPAHLAAAVDTPLVALFGPKPPGVMGPLGNDSRIERIYRDPSSASKAVRRGYHPRMWAITVDDVLAAIDRLKVHPSRSVV